MGQRREQQEDEQVVEPEARVHARQHRHTEHKGARVQRRVRGVAEVARGQRSQVYVDPADILRPVIITGASSFWCCHQHPSGRSECSAADRRLTKAIEKATKAATPDVEFAGHIVVGQGEWCDAGSGKVHKVK